MPPLGLCQDSYQLTANSYQVSGAGLGRARTVEARCAVPMADLTGWLWDAGLERPKLIAGRFFMRLVIQRVTEARVTVDENTTGSIGAGLLVLLGIAATDTAADADYLIDKLIGLRIFPDEAGKMNRSVLEAGGGLLIVSQFTLYADCRKGRRPGFDRAAAPEQARALYNYFLDSARARPLPVESGVFQAHMQVHLVNDGPVTILIDSADRAKS
jgi:D-tyrosyl-tRNA(Tyr) deacylase